MILTPKLQLCVHPFQISSRVVSTATPFRWQWSNNMINTWRKAWAVWKCNYSKAGHGTVRISSPSDQGKHCFQIVQSNFHSPAFPQQHTDETPQLLREWLQCSWKMQLQDARTRVTAFTRLAQAGGLGSFNRALLKTNHWIPPGATGVFYSAPWGWHHHKGPQYLSCLGESQLQGCCLSSISPLNTTVNFGEQWQTSTALTLRHFSFEMHFALTALARQGCRGGNDDCIQRGICLSQN